MRGKATAVHEHSASWLGSRVDRHGMRKLDAHDADAHTNADCHASPYHSGRLDGTQLLDRTVSAFGYIESRRQWRELLALCG
jgi:hypothetical protein